MTKSKIHVDIDEELKYRLKIIAANKKKSLRKIITEIVADYVKKNKC